MMRAGLVLAAAMLAAGCAGPAGVAKVELGSEMPGACEDGDGCAWAWWNATVVARGSFGAGLRWPTPEPPDAFFAQAGPPAELPWWWHGWSANATANGQPLQFGPSPESGYAYVNGKDAARAGSYFFVHDGEALFRSRWNWTAEVDQTDAQPGKIWGEFRNVTLSFDARWRDCERHATYWFPEPRAVDGTYMLVGSDVVSCG